MRSFVFRRILQSVIIVAAIAVTVFIVLRLSAGDPARIRSVRLSLTLADPQQRVRSQTFSTVAALRNRLP